MSYAPDPYISTNVFNNEINRLNLLCARLFHTNSSCYQAVFNYVPVANVVL